MGDAIFDKAGREGLPEEDSCAGTSSVKAQQIPRLWDRNILGMFKKQQESQCGWSQSRLS